MTRDAYIERRTSEGWPARAAGFAAAWFEAVCRGAFQQSSDTLEKLLGRKPTFLGDHLARAYSR